MASMDELTELDNLYKDKGKITTDLEIGQARLHSINQRIIEIINKASKNFSIDANTATTQKSE